MKKTGERKEPITSAGNPSPMKTLIRKEYPGNHPVFPHQSLGDE